MLSTKIRDVINLNKFTCSLENIRSNDLKQCFQHKTV